MHYFVLNILHINIIFQASQCTLYGIYTDYLIAERKAEQNASFFEFLHLSPHQQLNRRTACGEAFSRFSACQKIECSTQLVQVCLKKVETANKFSYEEVHVLIHRIT